MMVRNRRLKRPRHLIRFNLGGYDMEGYAAECVERFCELSNKSFSQLEQRRLSALVIIK